MRPEVSLKMWQAKEPYYTRAVNAGHMFKFEALHRLWWREWINFQKDNHKTNKQNYCKLSLHGFHSIKTGSQRTSVICPSTASIAYRRGHKDHNKPTSVIRPSIAFITCRRGHKVSWIVILSTFSWDNCH